MSSSTPTGAQPTKYHIGRVTRRERGASLTRPVSAEKSRFCVHSDVSKTATKPQTIAPPTLNGRATMRRPEVSSRDSSLMGRALRSGLTASGYTSIHKRTPSANSHSREALLMSMRKVEENMTRMQEKVSEGRNAALSAKKRSGFVTPLRRSERSVSAPRVRPELGRSPTPARHAPVKRGGSVDSAVHRSSPSLVNGKTPTPCGSGSVLNNRMRWATPSAAPPTAGVRGVKKTGNVLQMNGKKATPKPTTRMSRCRPVITVTPSKRPAGNGTAIPKSPEGNNLQGGSSIRKKAGTPAWSSLRNAPPHSRKSVDRERTCPSSSKTMTANTISSRRMDCRTETAPYIETFGDEAKQCPPKKLTYDVVDDIPMELIL